MRELLDSPWQVVFLDFACLSIYENPETCPHTYRGVDLKTTRSVPWGFSCTNSPPSCTWRKVVDGYNRNIFSLPKHHIQISRAFATLVRPIVPNTGCDPLFFTTSVGATHCFFYNTSNSLKIRLIKWKQRPGIRSSISKLCFLISRNDSMEAA